MKKVLWIVGMNAGADQAQVLTRAQQMGATAVCIRTDNAALPAAIPTFHAAGIEVRGWRWPAGQPGPHAAPHYYALDEAQYLTTTLMPAGLDGYVFDIESDHPGQVNDWNAAAHQPLAQAFCDQIAHAIASGVPTCGAPFRLGLTAGCQQPSNDPAIPWATFVQACDTLYPQAYWRASLATGPTKIHGGTPQSSYGKATAAWAPIAAGKPLVCMAGELGLTTTQEIAAYGKIAANQDELHFYADLGGADAGVLAAISQL